MNAESSRQQLPPQVGIGAQVTVDLIDEAGNQDAMTLRLVAAGAGDLAQDLLGADTPLGQAIRAKYEGDEVAYVMGDVRRVRIVAVIPGPADAAQAAAAQAQARRQAILHKARSDAERTNAEMFAASFSGKWGDYELGEEKGLEQDKEQEGNADSAD